MAAGLVGPNGELNYLAANRLQLGIPTGCGRLKNVQFCKRLQISWLCRKYLLQLLHGDVAAAENDNDLFARKPLAELEGGRE